MIYIDTDRDLVLVNNKVANMRTLSYVTDVAVLESMHSDLNAYLLNEDVGLTSQGLEWLAGQASKIFNWDWSKVLGYIKKFLPDTLEGWIHMGVDVISLILDIIGPFTAGIGNAASVVIDVIHGLYYIGASQNWPGFPDRRDKEFEYLLCGFITLGFAAVPIGGNAGSLGFKTFLKNNPIGKTGVAKFLEKLFASSIGKSIGKVFSWIFKMAGKMGRFFYKMFESLTKIPFIGGIFRFFGNTLKNGIAKVANGLDNLLIKLFKKPGVKEVFEKNSKELGAHFSKVMGDHVADKAVKKAAAETGEIAAKEILKTLPAYKSITSKLKLLVTHIITDKVNLTKGVMDCWALLAGKVEDTSTQLVKLKEVGMPVDKYNAWYIKYAFFIDEEDREDENLSEEDIIKIQKYLIEYADVYSAKMPPKASGKLDAKTIYSTREFFQYLIHQDISELEGEELDSAKELIEHCKNGLTELNKLDKKLFTKMKEELAPTTEGYLANFETFSK